MEGMRSEWGFPDKISAWAARKTQVFVSCGAVTLYIGAVGLWLLACRVRVFIQWPPISPARTVRPRGKLNHRYVLTCRAQHRRGLYYREESTLLAGWALAISSHAELLQRIPAIRDSNACLATIGIEHTPFTDQGRQVAVFIECCVPAITIVVITICVTVN